MAGGERCIFIAVPSMFHGGIIYNFNNVATHGGGRIVSKVLLLDWDGLRFPAERHHGCEAIIRVVWVLSSNFLLLFIACF